MSYNVAKITQCPTLTKGRGTLISAKIGRRMDIMKIRIQNYKTQLEKKNTKESQGNQKLVLKRSIKFSFPQPREMTQILDTRNER